MTLLLYLQEFQPRDDYRELLELCILFLGGVVPGYEGRKYSIRKYGSRSKARFMGEAIYALKVWMLGKQLRLTAQRSQQLLQFCSFVVSVYVQHWFTCQTAATAAQNDLRLLKELSSRPGRHYKLALQKLCNHLWYLSATLLMITLYNKKLSLQEKREIVAAVMERESPDDIPPRATLPPNRPIESLTLSDFASQASMRFFEITGLSSDFLTIDPSLWEKNAGYQQGLRFVSNLQVVNDTAERGVQLIKRYLLGKKMTTDEQQRQHLMLVVKKHHQMYNKYGTEK